MKKNQNLRAIFFILIFEMNFLQTLSTFDSLQLFMEKIQNSKLRNEISLPDFEFLKFKILSQLFEFQNSLADFEIQNSLADFEIQKLRNEFFRSFLKFKILWRNLLQDLNFEISLENSLAAFEIQNSLAAFEIQNSLAAFEIQNSLENSLADF